MFHVIHIQVVDLLALLLVYVVTNKLALILVGRIRRNAKPMGLFNVIPHTQVQALKDHALVMALRVVAHVATGQSAQIQVGQLECRAMLMGQFRVKNRLIIRIRALKVFVVMNINNRFTYFDIPVTSWLGVLL